MKSNNTTYLEICCILIMKLHVSACNGHHQVSITIKKSLHICVTDIYISVTQICSLFLIVIET